jgi:hypothetical protein
MPYQRFFAANALGGLIWGVGFTLIGWGVGYSFHQAELVAVWLSLGLLVGIIIIAGAVFLGGRKAEIDAESAFESSTTDTEATLNAELSEVRDQMEHNGGDADGGESTPAT